METARRGWKRTEMMGVKEKEGMKAGKRTLVHLYLQTAEPRTESDRRV